MSLLNNIGFTAAACTTLSFIPQLTKIRKQGGRDLSYGMLSIYLVGVILWLVYGIILNATAVIVANAVSILLVAAAIALKATIAGPPKAPVEGAQPGDASNSKSENSRPIVIQS